jgi:hypothetical protein
VVNFATNEVVSDGPLLDALLLQLASAMLGCIIDELLGGVTQDWRIDRVEAVQIHPTIGDPVVATANPNAIGTLGPTSVSFASSMVHIRTGQGGRRGRGRIFLPPPGEANITNSILDQSAVDPLVAFLTCVAGKFAGVNPTTPWRIGVLSRKTLTGIGGTFDNAFAEATQLTPEKNVAIMSSRKLNRGS